MWGAKGKNVNYLYLPLYSCMRFCVKGEIYSCKIRYGRQWHAKLSSKNVLTLPTAVLCSISKTSRFFRFKNVTNILPLCIIYILIMTCFSRAISSLCRSYHIYTVYLYNTDFFPAKKCKGVGGLPIPYLMEVDIPSCAYVYPSQSSMTGLYIYSRRGINYDHHSPPDQR